MGVMYILDDFMVAFMTGKCSGNYEFDDLERAEVNTKLERFIYDLQQKTRAFCKGPKVEK